MRTNPLLPMALALAMVGGGSIALANHVTQVDPAAVPTGFLTAHTRIDAVGVNNLARAANQATAWHTHPGPVLVAVRSGSLTYEDAHANRCRRTTYTAGEGFIDPGLGHVHRAVAGPLGAEFYPVYILPKHSETHLIDATAPEECMS
jgi:hypothetical protein